MKKGVSIFLLSFLALALLSITFVAAAPESSEIVSNIQNIFTPILEALFGESSNIFEQLLFALLIIAFVYMALDRVPIISDNPFALWTAAIASAILAVRFIATQKLVEFLLMPQGALGISLLTAIPLVIYFWFVEFGLAGSGSRVIRKMAWVIYAVVWAFIWYNQTYGASLLNVPQQWTYLYLVVALVSLALLLFDRTIQNAIAKSQGRTLEETRKQEVMHDIQRKINETMNRLADPNLTPDQERTFEAQLARLNKRYKRATKL